jgi:hypothetical protein
MCRLPALEMSICGGRFEHAMAFAGQAKSQEICSVSPPIEHKSLVQPLSCRDFAIIE